MFKPFLQNNFTAPDFSFVYDLDENTLNVFFEMTDLAVGTSKEMIEQNYDYVTSISLVQAREMLLYYNKLLDLYTDYELYEECEDIVFIIDNLEDHIESFDEEVGNMKEKP